MKTPYLALAAVIICTLQACAPSCAQNRCYSDYRGTMLETSERGGYFLGSVAGDAIGGATPRRNYYHGRGGSLFQPAYDFYLDQFIFSLIGE